MSFLDSLFFIFSVAVICGSAYMVWLSELEIDRIKQEQKKQESGWSDMALGFEHCRLGFPPKPGQSQEYYNAYRERYEYEQAVSQNQIN